MIGVDIMMGKTHVAIGMATAMVVMQPSNFSECIVAISGGVLGGVVADVDILNNDYKHDALIGQILAVIISGILLTIDYFMKYGICESVNTRNKNIVIAGLIFYLLLYVIGFISAHRTFTHSFLAMVLFSIAILMICPKISLPYSIGYLSHLVLDSFNKKKVPFLYPIGDGFCLKLFYAGKIADKIFMWLGFVCTIVLVMIRFN